MGNLDPQIGCPVGIEDDLELLFGPGHDLHPGHPRHTLDAGLDHVVDKPLVAVHGPVVAGQQLDEEPTQGLVGTTATATAELNLGRVGIPRQRWEPVEPADHLDQGLLHVGLETELEVDPATTGIGISRHLLEAW